MALDCSGPDLAASQGDMLLDSFIFAGDDRMVSEVWSAGRHIVTQGRHAGRDSIIARYRATIARLREAL
jgi:formimidoylglutamate deiminase